MTYNIEVPDHIDALVTKKHVSIEKWLGAVIMQGALEQLQVDLADGKVDDITVTRTSTILKSA